MWIALAVVALLLAAGIVVLLRLPSTYTMTRSIRCKESPDKVWSIISDPGDQRSWRTDLSNLVVSKEVAMVEKLSTRKLRKTGWMEVLQGGLRVKVETSEKTDPKRLVMTREPEDRSFKSEWSLSLEASGKDSQIVLTETLTVAGLKRRLSMWTSSTRAQASEKYLNALAEKLGDSTVVYRMKRTEMDD